MLVIGGVGVSVAAKRHFQRVGTNVYTFEEPGEFALPHELNLIARDNPALIYRLLFNASSLP